MEKRLQVYVNRFIEEHLNIKDLIAEIPGEDEEDKDLDCIYIHGLWCLVAGAFQELELVQQPKYAAMCAKLDSMLV